MFVLRQPEVHMCGDLEKHFTWWKFVICYFIQFPEAIFIFSMACRHPTMWLTVRENPIELAVFKLALKKIVESFPIFPARHTVHVNQVNPCKSNISTLTSGPGYKSHEYITQMKVNSLTGSVTSHFQFCPHGSARSRVQFLSFTHMAAN